jgi:hypothetical protein
MPAFDMMAEPAGLSLAAGAALRTESVDQRKSDHG